MSSCAELRSADECSTSAAAMAGMPPVPLTPGRVSSLRKCASTPMLCSLGPDGADGGLEVYVAIRPFQEFGGGLFKRLPRPLRNGVRDAGVCHFLTVFRNTRDGSIYQFDFGPQGGDIHVARGPLAALLNKDRSPDAQGLAGRRRRAVTGEVRERQLPRLPPSHMYVGTTRLSLSDIRAFNSLHHQRQYELHVNDCRHYVNALVKYSTGFNAASSRMLFHQWQRNRSEGRYAVPLADRVIRLGHLLTDVANWGTVKALGQASMAAVVALGSTHSFARLNITGPLAAGMRTRLAPAGAKVLLPVRQALVRKPVVTVGTAAVVASAAGGTPMVRETASVGARVASGVRSAVIAAASLAQVVGQRTVATTNQAVAVASGAARGAARLVARQPVGAATAAAAGVAVRSPGSPMRIVLPSARAAGDRAQRLALAVTSAAVRR